jgi:hypothetical protein
MKSESSLKVIHHNEAFHEHDGVVWTPLEEQQQPLEYFGTFCSQKDITTEGPRLIRSGCIEEENAMLLI